MEKIFNAIELAGSTKVPVMLLSNPGEGKTTAVELWAKANNYHCEVLIGSQYSQDEILGFQANNNGRLEILEPEWYRRINEARKPSVLFLDEMSAAHPSVQGALLNLCSSREIRGGKRLPDDCIIVSAANFKENLPDFCDILTPQINRFLIINLSTKNEDAVNTYLSFREPEFPKDRPLFKDVVLNKMSKLQERIYENSLKTEFEKLFKKYASKTSSNGYLDMTSPSPAYLYGALQGKVMNVITGRSLHYFSRTLKSCIELGYSTEFMLDCADGLIGYGTGNWSEDDESRNAQLENFKKSVAFLVEKVVSSVKPLKDTTDDVEDDDKPVALTDLLFADLKKGGTDKNLVKSILNEIDSLKEELTDKDLLSVENTNLANRFVSDYSTMNVWVKETTHKQNSEIFKSIESFLDRFDIYFESLALVKSTN